MPSITLTFPASVAQDAVVAFGRRMNLVDGNNVRRNATQAEIKGWLIGQARQVIREEVTDIMREAIVPPSDADIT